MIWSPKIFFGRKWRLGDRSFQPCDRAGRGSSRRSLYLTFTLPFILFSINSLALTFNKECLTASLDSGSHTGDIVLGPLLLFAYTTHLLNCGRTTTTLAKKIETTARTWRRRVISRACTRLCLACVAVSIFLARVVHCITVCNIDRFMADHLQRRASLTWIRCLMARRIIAVCL